MFVKILSNLIKECRKYSNNPMIFIQQSNMYSDMRNGKFNFNAYVDASDPSHIYMQQPPMKWAWS